MWIKLGSDYINLDNVAHVHFLKDENGTLVANVEMTTGHIKHFNAAEAETLMYDLEALTAGPAQ
jgi:hypothetical protein